MELSEVRAPEFLPRKKRISHSEMPKPRKVGRPRKPKGAGSTIISLRLNEALLERLRRAADGAGHGNLSREISTRLRQSFDRDLYKDLNPAERAICFLLLQLMGVIGWPLPADWHRYPVLFKAFRIAAPKLLAALEKEMQRKDEGEPISRSPYEEAIVKQWLSASPQRIARLAVDSTLSFLYFKPGAAASSKYFGFLKSAHREDDVKELKGTLYKMENARRDLQLEHLARSSISSKGRSQ
jgi:hypothetical protein